MTLVKSKASEIHKRVSDLLNAGALRSKPLWLDSMIQFPPIPYRPKVANHIKLDRPLSPKSLRFREDSLRKRFYRDHPWELARPMLISENDGRDYIKCDWSNLEQPHLALNGECVVRHTLYLFDQAYTKHMQSTKNIQKKQLEVNEIDQDNKETTSTVSYIHKSVESTETPRLRRKHREDLMDEAYITALKKFYRLRKKQEVFQTVALDEATIFGVVFGPSENEKQLKEEKFFVENWRTNATDYALKLGLVD